MRFHSHSDSSVTSTFADALLASLAPDGGLWMPDTLPRFDLEGLTRMGAMSFADSAAELAGHFVDDAFTGDELREICRDAYDFPLPIRSLKGEPFDAAMTEEADDLVMELFHGPTLAFKDFAARFMARCVSRLLERRGERRTILVATSGDTGGAIGDAFLRQKGVKVVILYPEGGVSEVQERQLTTMGARSNVRALRVRGTFDDCQALVKEAFADDALRERFDLMSANSINVGRVVPQSFYYFWSAVRLVAGFPRRPLVMSIPSGNLGNLTGGLMAVKMGAPISRFVVGHNTNDPFVEYLRTGRYRPRASIPTLSNAMDIGRPSNIVRIRALFDDDHKAIRGMCWGNTVSDVDTERHMRRTHARTGYVMCPHTTVGHLAMERYLESEARDVTPVTVATAHPAKFQAEVERILHEDIALPPALAKLERRRMAVTDIVPQMGALESYLDGFAR